LSPETLADHIDGPVCARSRQPFLGARAASLVGKPKRQLQLHDRLRFESETAIASSEIVLSSR
jgi:hypothetical protein